MKLCIEKDKFFKKNGELRTRLARKRSMIENAEAILSEYTALGHRLMVRQLFYQFVSRDLIENTKKNWNDLKDVIKDARCAGLLDWGMIEDRGRYLRGNNHDSTVSKTVELALTCMDPERYHLDKWQTQKYRVEVWVEKDSLVEVVGDPCKDRAVDVSYLSHRGQSGLTVYYEAAMRFHEDKRTPVILHLSDCDPAGFIMTANVRKRLEQFEAQLGAFGKGVEVHRIGLTLEQVKSWPRKLPPNRIKDSDSDPTVAKAKKKYVAAEYKKVFGARSVPVTWELDALTPGELDALIRDAVKVWRDTKAWKAAAAQEEQDRKRLQKIADAMQDAVAEVEADNE